MRKILLTGKDGQLGWELQRSLAPLGKVFAFDRHALNLLDSDNLRNVIRQIQPELIVNAAAYTAVDKAEVEQEIAYAINANAPRILAEESKKLNALLVHYSTDYIFDGTSKMPYREYDKPNPLNYYGKSKLEGEQAIQEVDGTYLILRSTWIYAARGNNFLLTMLRLAKERESLRIVGDQIGAPCWSRSIAEATSHVLQKVLDNGDHHQIKDVYHMTASGSTSWFYFAEAIFKIYKKVNPTFRIPELLKITSDEYPLPAIRPKNSVLSNEKLFGAFGEFLPDWKESLEKCMKK